MTIDYLVDIKKKNSTSSYIIDLRKIKAHHKIELSFDVILDKVSKYIIEADFKSCYELLSYAESITQRSDSYFLLEITIRAEEAISLFNDLDMKDYFSVLDFKKKLKSIARYGRSSRSAKLKETHKSLLKQLDNLGNGIIENEVLEKAKANLESGKDISFYGLYVLRLYDSELSKELQACMIKKLEDKVKTLDNAGLIKLLDKLYENEFLESEELSNLEFKFENFDDLLTDVDKCHSLYRLNRIDFMDEKISILTNALIINGFIGRERLHKEFIIKELQKNKETLVNLKVFKETGENIVIGLVSASSKCSNLIPCI